METLGKRIARLRRERELKQEELAAKLQAQRDADAQKVLEKNAAVEAEFAAYGEV